MTNEIIVAVDDGYAQMKAYAIIDGQQKRIKFDSLVSEGWHQIEAGREEPRNAYSIEDEFGNTLQYQVNVGGSGELSTINSVDDYHFSDINPVLINHALVEMGLRGKKVIVMCGLPYGDYFTKDFKQDRDKMQAKRKNVMRKVSPNSPEELMPLVTDAQVSSQSMAAWFEMMTDDNLQWNENIDQGDLNCVCDIGGGTTDITVIRGKGLVDHNSCRTINTGVLHVVDELERLISVKHDLGDALTISDYKSMLNTKKLKYSDEDISGLVEQAIHSQENKIMAALRKSVKNGASFKNIFLTGGGANLFSNIEQRVAKAQVAPDPEFANARGFYKLGLIGQKNK